MNIDDVKQAVGRRAADENVSDGLVVGMGTGSTAVWAIRRIAERLREGTLHDIVGVPTSFQSQLECERGGIPIRSLNDPAVDGRLDIIIDGADEVDPRRCLTKGGGAALLIEKLLAYNAGKVVIVVDSTKRVENLGLKFPIPVEIVPEARIAVTHALENIGAKVELRMALRKMGPVITDNGNMLLDITFPAPQDVVRLELEINRIPGVMENGLFTRIDPVIYVGHTDGKTERIPEDA